LATWWFSAPDPRFGFPLLYSMAICLAAWAISISLGRNPALIGRRLAWTLAVGVVVLVTARVHQGWHRRGMPMLQALARVTLPTPASPRGYSVLPEARVRTLQTDSGLVIHLPVHLDLAWDAPLPSAPAPTALGLDLRYLSLRRVGDPGAGFMMVLPSAAASATR